MNFDLVSTNNSLNLKQWKVQSWSDLKLFSPMWSSWKLTTSRNNFKKLQIRLFKLQISPMGNITCRQTCNHSKTLSYCYVSAEKHFCPPWNIRDHIPLKYVTVQVNFEHPVTISYCLGSRFESCNGISVHNLFAFLLKKTKEMFICIAKKWNQLYKF